MRFYDKTVFLLQKVIMKTKLIFLKNILPCFFLLSSLTVFGQEIDSIQQQASPMGGINKLALEYFKIDFTKEQRKILKGLELEFIYLIEKDGTPILEEIKGIDQKEIRDSLFQKTKRIPKFQPQIVNGEATSSLYFMKLFFPNYRPSKDRFFYQTYAYTNAKIDDFDYIKKSGRRGDLIVAAMANQFLMNPANHLQLGGGMRFDLSYTMKNNIGFGFNMNIYGNTLKKAFPIASDRQQLKAPPTLLLGLSMHKWFSLQKEKDPNFNIQIDLAYAIQNITARIDQEDQDWAQLKGFSPGLMFNYALRLGKERIGPIYGDPTIYAHNLNFHLALRPLFLDLKEATGLMIEAGVGYRISYHYLEEHKFKDAYLKRLN